MTDRSPYAPTSAAVTATAVLGGISTATGTPLVPYAAWTSFAAALSGAIARRNPG